jgi:hypothetical protein
MYKCLGGIRVNVIDIFMYLPAVRFVAEKYYPPYERGT